MENLRMHWVRTLFLAILAVAGLLAGAAPALAAFPNKAVTMIVPFGAGGGTDLIIRKAADVAAKSLGQSVAIVNVPGAGSAVGLMQCLRAKPDGYTLVFTAKNIVDLPYMGDTPKELSYKAFEPVMRLNFDPASVTVNASQPWKRLADFVAAAKAKPETLRFGHGGQGSAFHMSVLQFQEVSGARFILVPFGGQAPAITALLGNHVEAVPASPGEVLGHVRSGALRLLAVLAEKRSPVFPDVPTGIETGVNLATGTWRGILAPKGTPADVIGKLHDAFLAATKDKEFQNFMISSGFSIDYQNGKDFYKFMESESETSRRISEQLKTSK